MEFSWPVPALEKTKQEVGMETSELAMPPHLRPKLRQPAPPVPFPGQSSLSMTHQLPAQPQQPSTNLSTSLLRTRKIMVPKRWPGMLWSDPRSRRRWILKPRSRLRRRQRCLLSPRSRFLPEPRSGLPPTLLRSRFDSRQGQGPAAASVTEVKTTTATKVKVSAVAKGKVPLLPQSMRSRSSCPQGQTPTAITTTKAKVKVPLLPQSRRSRLLMSSRSRLLLPSGPRPGCRKGQGPAVAFTTKAKVKAQQLTPPREARPVEPTRSRFLLSSAATKVKVRLLPSSWRSGLLLRSGASPPQTLTSRPYLPERSLPRTRHLLMTLLPLILRRPTTTKVKPPAEDEVKSSAGDHTSTLPTEVQVPSHTEDEGHTSHTEIKTPAHTGCCE